MGAKPFLCVLPWLSALSLPISVWELVPVHTVLPSHCGHFLGACEHLGRKDTAVSFTP